jgi:uncharacterized protein YjlB
MDREPQDPGIQRHLFDNDGCIPNNPELPLLVYPGALPASGDLPSGCKALFRENGWEVAWRDGVFPYHHYHRIVHEVWGFQRLSTPDLRRRVGRRCKGRDGGRGRDPHWRGAL